MSVGRIIPAAGLFVGVGIMILIGIAILSGISDDVRETVGENDTAEYDAVVSTLAATLGLTKVLPWLLILIVLAFGMLFLVKIK